MSTAPAEHTTTRPSDRGGEAPDRRVWSAWAERWKQTRSSADGVLRTVAADVVGGLEDVSNEIRGIAERFAVRSRVWADRWRGRGPSDDAQSSA